MTRERRSYDAVVRAVERALAAAGVEHVFVGGIAVIAFGRRRTTEDVDVLAAYRDADVPLLLIELRKRGFRVSEWEVRAALAEGGHCTVDDTRSDYRIDLVPAATDSAKHALRHRTTIRSRGVDLPLARPEHTIVMKLKFGSDQDIEDAIAIYLRQKETLDLADMVGFARRQGVESDLEALRKKAEELERQAAFPRTPRKGRRPD